MTTATHFPRHFGMIPPQLGPEQMLAAYTESLSQRRLWLKRRQQDPSRLQHFLLRHAIDTVPYYRSLSRRQGLSINDVGSFPIMSRHDIVSGGRRLLSGTFEKQSLLYQKTSGTSGIPLEVARDSAAVYSFIYDAYRIMRSRIPEFSKRVQKGKTAVVIVNDNPDRFPTSCVSPAINNAVMHGLVIGTAPETDREIVKAMSETSIPLLCGRPRTILRLAELMNYSVGDRAIKPRSIMTSGDNLRPDQRRQISQHFGCAVYDAYVSQEGGFVAAECPAHNGLHVFSCKTIVHVRRDDGTIGGSGTGELVITNLENWGMPFIRYATGDACEVSFTKCNCGYIGQNIDRISGRDSTYFLINGKKTNPSVLNPVFEQLPIQQFQVVQDSSLQLHVKWIGSLQQDVCVSVSSKIASGFERRVGLTPSSIVRVKQIGKHNEKTQRYVRYQ